MVQIIHFKHHNVYGQELIDPKGLCYAVCPWYGTTNNIQILATQITLESIIKNC